MSRLLVVMCDVSHVTAWHGDGETGELISRRDTRQKWRRESLGVCIRLMPVTQWLHAPCLTMISFIVLDLVSGNRKSSVSHWVGLLGWELRVCDQVLMLQMPQVFLHWPALLLLPASEFSLSDSNYQLFSSNAPRSFALKSLVQALS